MGIKVGGPGASWQSVYCSGAKRGGRLLIFAPQRLLTFLDFYSY